MQKFTLHLTEEAVEVDRLERRRCVALRIVGISEPFGKITDSDERSLRPLVGGTDNVGQLDRFAGPSIGREAIEGFGSEAADLSLTGGVQFFHKVLCQGSDIFGPRSKGGHFDYHDGEPGGEIRTKAACLGVTLQRDAGGGHDAPAEAQQA